MSESGESASSGISSNQSLSSRLNEYLSSPRTIEKINESCIVTTIRNGIVGFGFGGLIGLFLSGIPSSASSPHLNESLPLKGQVRAALKDMRIKTWSSAKNFGLVSVLFSAFECGIEKYRAKTDIFNTMGAGCASGAILARGSGAKGMLVGCAGFASFSAAMEHFLAERD